MREDVRKLTDFSRNERSKSTMSVLSIWNFQGVWSDSGIWGIPGKLPAMAVLAAYLGIAAVIDLLKKKLPVYYLVLGVIPAACGMISAVTAADLGETGRILISHAIGAGIGLFFLIICAVTREKLGKADAILFTVCGAATGYEILITLIMFSFLLSAVYAVAMLAIGRMNRKSAFAFAPFILLGFIMTEVLARGT